MDEDYYEEYYVDRNDELNDRARIRSPFLDDRLNPPALILEPNRVANATIGMRIIMASGGFDPLHPGHVGYLRSAAELARHNMALLVVVVNGDGFLTRKKGRPFMPLKDRCEVVAGLSGVDVVMPFDDEGQTVDHALRLLHPLAFAKGGDRFDESTIPEWVTCQELGIKVITGVGPDKIWSSSSYIADEERARLNQITTKHIGQAAVVGAALRLGTCEACGQYDPGGRHWNMDDAMWQCPPPSIKFRRGITDARNNHPPAELTPEYMAGYKVGKN